jgi:hypothetical protein
MHLHQIKFKTRGECLIAIGRALTLGSVHHPLPPWWEEFEKWYGEIENDEKCKSEDEDEGGYCIALRLDPAGAEHEYVDDDND